jgi:hypothetical protein
MTYVVRPCCLVVFVYRVASDLLLLVVGSGTRLIDGEKEESRDGEEIRGIKRISQQIERGFRRERG